MRRKVLAGLVMLVLLAAPALAQQTTGNISGKIIDQQGAIIPGATVTATNPATGFTRSVVSDAVGIFTLTALPIGNYDLKVELSGFQPTIRKGVVVNVSQTVSLDLSLSVAALAENVTVTGEAPLIQTTNSTVGGVVDVDKIESLPLNGRQFANLAMTVAGVAMGFHSDPTKSTQYSPQIAGGNGRNVNYQIDGGDNNDDTVGGLLQLFPLEAIQEFNMITSRYKAEYGRSNGGVMNIVTKSGTNQFGGSWFTMFRNDAMNGVTMSEKQAAAQTGALEPTKSAYERYQFGGSFGGPIVKNRAHFFVAAERTDQTTQQILNIESLFAGSNKPPEAKDGVYDLPMAENLFTVKSSINVSANQYLSIRYGRNTNSQVYGVGSRSTPDNWGDSTNTFNSINVNHNWVLGGSKLNEFIFQYADFANNILGRATAPGQSYPNGVVDRAEREHAADDDPAQVAVPRRLLVAHGGHGRPRPRLQGRRELHLRAEAVRHVQLRRAATTPTPTSTTTRTARSARSAENKDGSAANLPMKQFGMYFQDDWKIAQQRHDQRGHPLRPGDRLRDRPDAWCRTSTSCSRTRRRACSTASSVSRSGARVRREDYNNVQPRIGMAWDVRGNGKDIVRAGWGLYYDFGYTNANILFPAPERPGRVGADLRDHRARRTASSRPTARSSRSATRSRPWPARTKSTQRWASAARTWRSPRVKQPYTNQFSAGWSHQLTRSTVVDVDYIMTRGTTSASGGR